MGLFDGGPPNPLTIGELLLGALSAGEQERNWQDLLQRSDEQTLQALGLLGYKRNGNTVSPSGGGLRDQFNRALDALRYRTLGDKVRDQQDFLGNYDQDTTDILKRFGEVAGSYGDRYRRGMGFIKGQGGAATRDIEQQFTAATTGDEQNLVDRGLSGTTIGASLNAGRTRERRRALLDLQEQLNAQRLGVEQTLGADALSANANLAEAYAGRKVGRTNYIGMTNEDISSTRAALGQQKLAGNLDLGSRAVAAIQNAPIPYSPVTPLQSFYQGAGGMIDAARYRAAVADAQPSDFERFGMPIIGGAVGGVSGGVGMGIGYGLTRR